MKIESGLVERRWPIDKPPTVVLTRPFGPNEAADTLGLRIQECGFTVERLPVLKVEPLPLDESDQKIIRTLETGGPDWVAWLSPTSVYVTRDLLQALSNKAVVHPSIRLAAEGPGTSKACEECFQRVADLIPPVFIAEEFADALSDTVPASASILLLQAADGRNVVGPTLSARGRAVQMLSTYRTVPIKPAAASLQRLIEIGPDNLIFLFMSPSAVTATADVFRHVPSLLRTVTVVTVGPTTSRAAQEAGCANVIEAQSHSEEGVFQRIKSFLSNV